MAREVAAVRNAVGGIEIANFAKHEFKGFGARAYLNRLLARHIPRAGRLSLTSMLTPQGRLYGDLTIACLVEDHFMLIGSGSMQEAHRRWFEASLPSDVAYSNASDLWHGIALSGPKSRDLLAKICRDDVSGLALKFRDTRHCFVGGVPVILNRISFSGELGFEIYCRPHYLCPPPRALTPPTIPSPIAPVMWSVIPTPLTSASVLTSPFPEPEF